MGRKKLDRGVSADVVDDEVDELEASLEAGGLTQEALEVPRNALVQVGQSALVATLEQEVASLKAEVEALRSAPAARTSLTDEQRSGLQFCHTWVSDVRRRSRSVPFRQEAQEALSVLSQLLA